MDQDGTRILYIDDDEDARSLLGTALSQRGYTVVCVRDGETGLTEHEREPFDLVLLDLTLPKTDGLEVCRRIKALSGESFVPVIFLTARSEVAEKVKALESGGDDFCVKPILLDELEARMRVLLRMRSRERVLRAETQKFRRIALVDPLTELWNRRSFEAELERAWARLERGGRPLALLMVDIDRFKAFNDRYGHRTGDEVLRATARAIKSAIRKGDQAFRLGGEEFVVLAPDSSREGALVIAERVRSAIAAEKVQPPPDASSSKLLSVTASVGVAVAPDPSVATSSALVEASDRALYDAKAAGRDRVALATTSASTV